MMAVCIKINIKKQRTVEADAEGGGWWTEETTQRRHNDDTTTTGPTDKHGCGLF